MPYCLPCFNPRTHEGCDIVRIVRITQYITFQSTHPRGVRRKVMSTNCRQICFNPRTHEGCDNSCDCLTALLDCVSIHAPTRGATIVRSQQIILIKVSIHAPTRGATISWWNSEKDMRVSIHAPTRGATYAFTIVDDRLTSFNPRTHEGCDLSCTHCPHYLLRFQSTHPRGVRLIPKYGIVRAHKFQSTHPRGVRLDVFVSKQSKYSFQSTHPRGVRRDADGH